MTPRLKPTLLLATVLLFPPSAPAQEPAPVAGDKEPVLRVEPEGPMSFVTALAFDAGGKRLYAGGWDKVVRVWALDDQGKFVPDRVPAYRLPVGPGLDGAINTLALSDDGVWLAVAGKAVFRETAGIRQIGFVVPSLGGMTDEMRRDMGTVTLFNTRDRTVRLLRGHEGTVEALAFAPPHPNKPPLLLSTARERNAGAATFSTSARLWDVDRGETVATLTGLPDASRPGVAVWHTGREVKQVRAALALDDGVFRLWNPAGAVRDLSETKGFLGNKSVALLPAAPGEGARLVTADAGDLQARLTRWQVPADGAPRVIDESRRSRQVTAFARAMGLASRRGDGRSDLAAVVLQVPHPGNSYEYRLQLADLENGAPGKLQADFTLWEGSPRQPALATSPRGTHLAVAGNEEHEIRVYNVSALLRGEKNPQQRLRSKGLLFRAAAFVDDGKTLGLTLNTTVRKSAGQSPPAPDPARGDLLFDPAHRRLTSDLAGWRISTPDVTGWQVRSESEGNRRSLAVYRDGRLVGRTELAARHEVSDFALLPPRGAVKLPLLALATHDAGQPLLALHNAATGELLRQFSGHSDRVFSLAFSGDGRLLVSTAEDQTVRVWTLTDLDQVLGKRGRLPGLIVAERQGGLVVVRVPEQGPIRERLRPGDVLSGLVEDRKFRPLDTPLAFYQAVFAVEPGKSVTLRRTAPQPGDVLLDAGQGADERKPLFSLFVARDDRSDRVTDGAWIGWNPLGPYESSSPRAERFLGWHFNTGDARAPTRFALADAHRKEYYREGLLQTLVARGTLVRVDPALPPPALVFLVQEGERLVPQDGQGPLKVSSPRVTLKLDVLGRPLDSLEGLTWRLDDGEEQKLAADAPLAVPLTLRRGDQRVTATAWTRDIPPKPYPRELVLRYQPPAPQVKFAGKKPPQFVRESKFELEALVYPGVPGEEVRVSVHHWHQREDLTPEAGKPHRIDPNTPLKLTRRLDLRPGNNTLEIVAVNQDAPKELQAAETDRFVLEVFYVKKANPPTIRLTGVKSPEAIDQRLLLEPLQALVVHAPKVRLEGRIEASEELLEAGWFRGEAMTATAFTGFRPKQSKELALSEVLTLKPGRQNFRIRARTESSDVAERDLTIEYRPLLPVASLEQPADDTVLFGEKDTTPVALRGRLRPAADPHPYRAVVLLNGKEAAGATVTAGADGVVSATVAAGAGDNRIRLRLSNEWGSVAETDDLHVRYLRPPRVEELKHLRADGRPVLTLEARVRTPVPLLPDSLRISVNGEAVPGVKADVGLPAEGTVTVRVQNVPLQAGAKQNVLRMWVSNAEAECREPGLLTVETAQVLPPPVVDLLLPGQGLTVARPELSVKFRIRSLSPLAGASLILEGRPPLALDVSKARRDSEGHLELNGEQEVPLSRGLNYVRLEAVNLGGREVSGRRIVNYVPPPLQLVVDSLTPVRLTRAVVRPQRLPGGRIALSEPLEQGLARLRGRVLWGDESAARSQADLVIRAFVNGFQQTSVRLRPGAGQDRLESPFEADVLFSREQHNHVILMAPGQDASDHCEFLVDCRHPVRQQRLHLLALSPDGRAADDLPEQVLRAMQSGPDRAPAFEEVKVYRPLLGSQVRAPYIFSSLASIRTAIELARVGAPMNDVVMIYYRGGETVNERGNFFQTYSGQSQYLASRFGIPCDRLVEFLAETPGAHVLLLDVDREPPAQPLRPDQSRDKVVHWKDDYPEAHLHVGVIRHAWLGKAGQPAEVRLITLLQKSVPQAARLSQVVELMEKATAAVRTADLLIYTYVPSDLRELLVGGRR